MRIKDIFNLGIEMGIEADFRGRNGIEKLLKKRGIEIIPCSGLIRISRC